MYICDIGFHSYKNIQILITILIETESQFTFQSNVSQGQLEIWKRLSEETCSFRASFGALMLCIFITKIQKKNGSIDDPKIQKSFSPPITEIISISREKLEIYISIFVKLKH